MTASATETSTKINDIVEALDAINFDNDNLKLTFKYYYLIWMDSAETYNNDPQLKTALTIKLESDLTQDLKVDSWTHTLARLASYSQRFLIEQTMRREGHIYDNTSQFDQKINDKLMRLAGRIAKNTDPAVVDEAKILFADIAKSFTIPEGKAEDLLAEHNELSKQAYSAIRSQLCHLINPEDPHNTKSPGMNDSHIVKLLTFLLDLQDSSHQEFDGFALLANIKKRYFNLEISDESDYHQRLEEFSKLLIDIFFHFEAAPTGPYQDFEKLALLEYYKRTVNQFSDQYNLPYRIKKVKHNDTGEKFTENELIIKNCKRQFEKLQADNIKDTFIAEPTDYATLSLVELKKLDAKLTGRVNTYYKAATVAEQCADVLSALDGLRPYHKTQQQDEFINSYKVKCKKIITDTANNADARLEKFEELHTELFSEFSRSAKHLQRADLIDLAGKLLAIYPYVPLKHYSHYDKFARKLQQLRNNPLVTRQAQEANTQALRDLIAKIHHRIQQKHVEERPTTYVNFTPDGRKFEFDYEVRDHSHAKKKARRTDKAIISSWSWPLRITLALFQAAVSFGGTVEYFTPLVAGWIAMTVGGVGFILSYISNDQLVSNPLYRLLIDAILDNNISKAENSTARNLFKIAFLLCIGTGLTMAIVALSFSLSLFTEPAIALLITLAALDVIPTTLGFGALMFKTFEEFVLSIVNFFKALTWENCKFMVENTYNRLAAANVEDRAVLILTGILTPLIIVGAVALTAFTTIGMIGAWYVKVSAFFIEHLAFTPWASSAAAFLLVGVCSMPIRSVFNIKNIMWMGFFGAEFVGRYCIVKPILTPFRIAEYLKNHSDTLIDATAYYLRSFWSDVKADPHLYSYRKWYRFKRSLDITSWFAVIWTCVAFNGGMTGLAAFSGGGAVKGIMPSLSDRAAGISAAGSNAGLSFGANSKSVMNKMKSTPGSANDMPIKEVIAEEDNDYVIPKRNKFKPHMPKAFKQLKAFGIFKPLKHEIKVVEHVADDVVGKGKNLYRCAKNEIKHGIQAVRGGYTKV